MSPVYGSNQGAFKEATGMWVSKSGLWTPISTAAPEPPGQQPYDKWSLADWSIYPPTVDTATCWPTTGWSAIWSGTDLVINHPAASRIWLDDWFWAFIVIPNDSGHPHPHLVNPVPEAVSITAKWTAVQSAAYPAGVDYAHYMSYMNALTGVFPGQAGFFAFSEYSITEPVQPEFLLHLIDFIQDTPPVFPSGLLLYAIAGYGPAPATQWTVSGVETKWGFSTTPAPYSAGTSPTDLNMSDEFMQAYHRLMTEDTSTLTDEQRNAVEAIRRIDPMGNIVTNKMVPKKSVWE